MISEESKTENEKPPEEPLVCARCNFWNVYMVRPQDHQGIGACVNQDDEEAPFGLITAGFCTCGAWQIDRREKPKIIKTPAGMSKKLRNRIISG